MASPVVCANRLDAGQFTGTIGMPLGPAKSGEISVRGPQVMQGY